jgi:hypothetical protein
MKLKKMTRVQQRAVETFMNECDHHNRIFVDKEIKKWKDPNGCPQAIWY